MLFDDALFGWVVQMAIVKKIHMVSVLDRGVTAILAMDVFMIGVGVWHGFISSGLALDLDSSLGCDLKN